MCGMLLTYDLTIQYRAVSSASVQWTAKKWRCTKANLAHLPCTTIHAAPCAGHQQQQQQQEQGPQVKQG